MNCLRYQRKYLFDIYSDYLDSYIYKCLDEPSDKHSTCFGELDQAFQTLLGKTNTGSNNWGGNTAQH